MRVSECDIFWEWKRVCGEAICNYVVAMEMNTYTIDVAQKKVAHNNNNKKWDECATKWSAHLCLSLSLSIFFCDRLP